MSSPPHRFKPTPFESNHSAAENRDDNITVRRDRCARAFLHRAWSPACPTADQISFATHFFFPSPKSRCFFGNLLGHNSTRLHSTHFTFIIVNWRSHERLFSGFFSQLPPCNKEKKNENKHPENCWRLLCLFASMAQATNHGGLANSWWYETDDGNVYVTRDDASCVVQTLYSRKSANGCLCWVVGDKKIHILTRLRSQPEGFQHISDIPIICVDLSTLRKGIPMIASIQGFIFELFSLHPPASATVSDLNASARWNWRNSWPEWKRRMGERQTYGLGTRRSRSRLSHT